MPGCRTRAGPTPVVILRLRGRTSLGSTFFGVVAGYADALQAAGGRLYLSGVQPEMVHRFHRSQLEDVQGKIRIFHATEVLGESTLLAVQDAQTWLVGEAAGRDGAEHAAGSASASMTNTDQGLPTSPENAASPSTDAVPDASPTAGVGPGPDAPPGPRTGPPS